MSENRNEERQALRIEMMKRRAAMSQEQVQWLSAAIVTRMADLVPLIRAQRIMVFASINNEVDLRPFIQQQAEQGKIIFLPRTNKDGNLDAVEFKGWENTKTGAFGICEPQGEETDIAQIEAVIVPGLVFDGHGFRLGYGKGYYDRFLCLLASTVFTCGVCYEFQVVDNVYPHIGDVPVHWIVTEKSELAINWDFF